MRTDLPFIVHEFKVFVRNMSDIELHQEIVGQWNATRDFDEDEMNILIEELDRRAKAQEALNRMVAENQRLGLYDDAVNMTQDRVDETAKDRLVRIMGTFDLSTGHADTLDQALDALEEELRDVLGHLRAMREWVGLTDADIAQTMHGSVEGSNMLPYQFARAIEAKLKEKNT